MRLRQFAVWLLLAWLGAGPVHAQSVIEKLVSPGALATAHASLESRCEACHAQFDKSAQSKLCIACHKPIGADLANGRGYHGHVRAASAECRTCHADHKGRAFALVSFDKKGFDHRMTDYPLVGKHAGVPCADCHRAGHKYREAPLACNSCHASKDVHHGSLGTACANCHNEEDWKKAKFDHSKTQFPLLGAHANAKCEACHADKRFKGTPVDCVSCHRKDDTHKGSLGPKCASCHGVSAWKPAKFDHESTGFPLLGRHNAIACAACHVSPAGAVKLPPACISCHRKDDTHKGKLGPECGQCHTASSWKQETFDHSKTQFPLRGHHAEIDCAQCHTVAPKDKKLPLDCYSCHAKDDKHDGQLGRACQQCHGEKTWKDGVRFDHDLVAFPLLGKHAGLECKQCHETARFKDAKTECIACHRKDDRHKGTLGTKCEDCHGTTSWKRVTFNHDTQTKFPLTGGHARVECAGCHREGLKVSTFCLDCHRNDDVHQGNFGPRCDRCHTTESFHQLKDPS